METLSQEAQYKVMHGLLNERQWRLYVATEAKRRGTGGISQVAQRGGSHTQDDSQGIARIGGGRTL